MIDRDALETVSIVWGSGAVLFGLLHLLLAIITLVGMRDD